MVMVTTICAAIGIGTLLWNWPRLKGTTLIAPAVWSLLVFALLPMAAFLSSSSPDGGTPLAGSAGLRLIVATACCCPAMAVFGAKRPQAAAWQFIVGSLWLVLAIPGLRVLLLGDGSPVVLHSAQSWFLFALWSMAAVNYLPTRYAVPGLLVAAAQLALTCEYLPLPAAWQQAPWLSANVYPLAAALLMTAALVVGSGLLPRAAAKHPLDRRWIDFRDAFGAVWGLRCQQRINQSAEMYGWPVRLEWNGFATVGANPINAELDRAIRNNLGNMLRRFVSPEWIAERSDSGERPNQFL